VVKAILLKIAYLLDKYLLNSSYIYNYIMALGYKTTTAFFSNINYLVNNTTKVADSTGKITDGVPKVLTGLDWFRWGGATW
jgi:hypothetical protein